MYTIFLVYISFLVSFSWSLQAQADFDHEVCGSWKRYGNSCYMRVYQKVTRDKADISCRGNGAFLVEVDDALEQRFVFEHLTKVPIPEGVWTGLVRVTDGPEWTWNGRKPLKFELWGYGEPNDFMKQGEKCSEMRYWDGKWNDVLCTHRLSYICEKEIQVQQSPTMSTDTTRINGALTGHVFRAANVTGVMDCFDQCQANPQCLSFNYEHSTINALKICELNNSTRGFVGGSRFISRIGFTYYD